MIAASNASTKLHPENTLVKFENELPTSFNVSGYKVALQSLFLDNKYGNIPNSILGTRNHFLLFLTTTPEEAESRPIPNAIYNITDFTMDPKTFVNLINRAFGKPTTSGRIRFSVDGGKIKVTLNRCILLIHSEVNKCLNFSSQLFNYLGEKYVILNSKTAVSNVSSKNQFPREPIAPRLIKVRLFEMCRNLSDVSLVQDLAVIRTQSGKTYPFYNVSKRKEYFNLACFRLNTLSVQLVDEHNWPIHLGSGQPTFLKLQLKKFPMKSFVLRLSSFESQDVFTDNTNSSFRISLQQQLDCGMWDVALSSVLLPSKTNLGSHLNEDNFYIELPINLSEEWRRITLHDLEDFSNEGFKNHLEKKMTSTFPNGSSPITVVLENDALFLQCNVKIKLRISGMLAYLLTKASSPNEPKFWPFEAEAGEKKILGSLNFDNLHPHAVLIYCNFITPLVVGSTFGRVLQLIPYYDSGSNQDGLMKYEVQHLDFIPLAMNDRSTLHFEMRDSSGDLIKFKDEDSEVLITVVFREKM